MINVTLKDFGQRPIGRASILVDRIRLKQLFHASQNRPSCCAFYWVTTFSSDHRVSGWPRGRNVGGVTGELRRLGLRWHVHDLGFGAWGSSHIILPNDSVNYSGWTLFSTCLLQRWTCFQRQSQCPRQRRRRRLQWV